MSFVSPSKITVERFASNDDATLSIVRVDGEFVCFGVEDEFRAEKVANETRIPSGLYDIRLRNIGGFDARYEKKFHFHKGMLQVQDVPGFEYILIHIGNTEKDTAGCLLVNEGVLGRPDEMSGQSSTNAYKRLYSMVLSAAEADALTIEYIDKDK